MPKSPVARAPDWKAKSPEQTTPTEDAEIASVLAQTTVAVVGEMSDEQLLLHINHRHPEAWPGGRYRLLPIGNIRIFSLFYRRQWEVLHERLHRGGARHEHQ